MRAESTRLVLGKLQRWYRDGSMISCSGRSVTARECAIEHTSRRAAPGEAVDGLSIRCIFSSATFALTSALRGSSIEPRILSSRSAEVILGTVVITMASFGRGLSGARLGA
jgi:hypothetical protein